MAAVSKGDFIELIAPHAEAGKRGYVLGRDSTSSSARIILDEPQQQPHFHPHHHHHHTPQRRTLSVPLSRLKLIRAHRQEITTSIISFKNQTAPWLGTLAATCKPPTMNPQWTIARFPRPPAKDLPGPQGTSIKFRTPHGEEHFDEIFQGNFIVTWHHSFEIDGVFWDWMLEMAQPAFNMTIYRLDGQGIGTTSYFPRDPRIRKGTECIIKYLMALYGFHHVHRDMLAARVLHLLLRLVGADLGYRLARSSWTMLATITRFMASGGNLSIFVFLRATWRP